ncbi:DUF1328 domain-containing protein [Brevundimonas pondensis]|uniref:DUF1328 domain-containing protein n=1 Tax=Brevundimonas pondensis TaxID=2774189 RepID=UPI003D175F8F
MIGMEGSKFHLHQQYSEDRSMLRWAIIFFIIALVAAVLGFGGISGMSFEIAKFIAIIAVILFVVSLVVGGVRGRGPRI